MVLSSWRNKQILNDSFLRSPCIYHSLAISQPHFSHIKSYQGHLLTISLPYLSKMLVISQPYLNQMSAISHLYIIHISSIYQAYFSHISRIFPIFSLPYLALYLHLIHDPDQSIWTTSADNIHKIRCWKLISALFNITIVS